MTRLETAIALSLPCAFLLIVTLTQISACPSMCTCNETMDALVVDCSSQNLSTIPSTVPLNTTHLIFRDNQLETLESLDFCSGLQKLIFLDLSWNDILQIEEGDFLNCNEVKYLDVSYNNVRVLPTNSFWGLQKTELLDLSGNKIYDLDNGSFLDLLKIKELRLHDNLLNNDIEKALIARDTLKILDLSKNRIKNLKNTLFDNLINLTTLSLRTNIISVVEAKAFSNQETLENLDLSYNPLYCLPEDTFDTLINLNYLELSADSLAAIVKMADRMNYTNYWFKVMRNMKGVLMEMPGYQNGTNMYTNQKMGIRYMDEVSTSSAAVLNLQQPINYQHAYLYRRPNSDESQDASRENY